MSIKRGAFFSDSLVECLEQFNSVHQVSERTFNEYVSRIRTVTDYFCKDFLDIDEADAALYFSHLEDKCRCETLKSSSVYAKLCCFNKIAEYIENECSYVDYANPFKKISLKVPSSSIKVNCVPTTEDLDKILSAAPSEMYYLIYALVLRVALSLSDILSLTFSQIVESNGVYAIRILPKSVHDSERLVGLPDDVSSLLLSYINKMEYVDNKGHLFYNTHGTPLERRTFYTHLKKSLEKAGVNLNYTMKDLRSRSIIDMITASVDNGAAVQDVADYVGIKDVRLRTYIKTGAVIATPPSSLVNIKIKEYEG